MAPRVILTRPVGQSRAWQEALQSAGHEVLNWPLIETSAVESPDALDRAWQERARCRAWMFVSAPAVQHFFARRPAGADLAGVRCWATGPGTRRALHQFGVVDDAIDAPVAILTGEYGARILEPLVAALGRDDVRVVAVENRFFGGNTAVAGLLTGSDLSRVLADEPEGHRYLLPDVCLSQGRFLDGTAPEDLPRVVEIVPTDGIALRRALGEVPAAPVGPERVAR